VLKSPPPTVILSALAEAPLKLELRVYIHGVENLLQSQQDQVRNELNLTIEKVLREFEAPANTK
jgi:small-conductance mechanosensitive channel